MEIDDENVKYSFLLGSTLRNEDADQFLRVYDAVIPKDTPLQQVFMALHVKFFQGRFLNLA